MNGINFVADTNALIYLLNGNPCMTPLITADKGFNQIEELNLEMIAPVV